MVDSKDGPGARRARRLDDHQSIIDAISAVHPSETQLLAAMSLLDRVRLEIDIAEHRLIECARQQNIGWARIATALGLSSRQAAEQRWFRLSGNATRDPTLARSSQRHQRSVDSIAGKPIRELRAAVITAGHQIRLDPGWDARHPRAALARTSLETATSAEPGALHALASHALDDIDSFSGTDLPTAVREALQRLRQSRDAATPLAKY